MNNEKYLRIDFLEIGEFSIFLNFTKIHTNPQLSVKDMTLNWIG